MTVTAYYDSPVGKLLLASEDSVLCGLWFADGEHCPGSLKACGTSENDPGIQAARKWLDLYFDGKDPGPLPPLRINGSVHQQKVLRELMKIPYGKTMSYGELALKVGSGPRAVGNAVGRNDISIIIPCHRIVAAGGIGGYGGGIERKRFLLGLEGIFYEK